MKKEIISSLKFMSDLFRYTIYIWNPNVCIVELWFYFIFYIVYLVSFTKICPAMSGREGRCGIDELIERNPDQLKIYFTPQLVSIPLERGREDTLLLISTQMPFIPWSRQFWARLRSCSEIEMERNLSIVDNVELMNGI